MTALQTFEDCDWVYPDVLLLWPSGHWYPFVLQLRATHFWFSPLTCFRLCLSLLELYLQAWPGFHKTGRAITIVSLDIVHAFTTHIDFLFSFQSIFSYTITDFPEVQSSFAIRDRAYPFLRLIVLDLFMVHIWWIFLDPDSDKLDLCADLMNTGLGKMLVHLKLLILASLWHMWEGRRKER
jgi:hypothetical protein